MSEERNDVVRRKGRIKWFNQFKGYGFVEVDGIQGDVFLHFFAVDRFGRGRLNNDDIILCDIIESEKGYQVKDVIELLQSNKYEIDDGNLIHTEGEVKWFNPSKGFGFAQLDSGEDVFIHSSLLKKYKMTTIESGRRIRLTIHRTNFGYEATDIGV
ncbi:MAG: cold shock domain-containing protein [Holosporaceae bacterium]|jgi:CspA family cold shock protein|nr:cold shock domain-containing protein [Holosporaceae bacterium]